MNVKFIGKGVIDSPDGERYAGEFFENERNGFGVFINQNPKDLKSFRSFYKHDMPSDLGEAEYLDGSVFRGYWHNGQRHGHGIMFYSDNTNYMGRWLCDKRSGYGVLRNNIEGWRYLSLWKEDRRHGRGIFISSDDVFVQCIFSFGQIMGEGLVYHENPDTHEQRVYVGNVTTSSNDSSNQIPVVEFGGKEKLVVTHDNVDGEKTCINIEGVFSGTIWDIY